MPHELRLPKGEKSVLGLRQRLFNSTLGANKYLTPV